MKQIDLTNEVGQSKRNRKNSYRKGAFGTNNERDGRKIIIMDNKEYTYEKCDHRVIENWIRNQHANVNRAQPVRRRRLIREDHELSGLDQIRNSRLKDFRAKHQKYSPVTSSRIDHVPKYTRKKEVREEGHKGKCNKLHKKNIRVTVEEKNCDDDTSTEVEIFDSDDDTFTDVEGSGCDDDTSTEVDILDSNDDTSTEVEILDSNDDTSTEVEILDSDEVMKRGTSSVFVPSKIYRSDLGASKASSNYREKVLNILEKPFDMAEYRMLSDEVKFYLAKYPDLKEKLAENRYKRLSRMTILRGFFYWLQHVMHNEAFQPWKDSQCLAVLPGESGR